MSPENKNSLLSWVRLERNYWIYVVLTGFIGILLVNKTGYAGRSVEFRDIAEDSVVNSNPEAQSIVTYSTSLINNFRNDTTPYPFDFRDVSNVLGIIPDASVIRGHSAAWGDVNGDGLVDLYIGTFNESGIAGSKSKPNMLFINKDGQFVLSEQQSVRLSTRSTGSIFADLDNDGDLDLFVGNMPKRSSGLVGNSLLENVGNGKFVNISEGNGATPQVFGGRSATVLDYDGDGLLDIVVGEEQTPGYNGSTTHSFRLFHNLGNLQFEDVTQKAGIRQGIPGYGVAAADVNDDGWPDFFVASAQGGNKLFINNQDGTFTEASYLNELFEWPGAGGDKMVCGVSFGDVNRDGKLDIILGPHFLLPAKNQEPVRLFLNEGNNDDGMPTYKEVTEEAGLKPFGIKLPHVELQDMDNDGWPDIMTSAVRFKDGKPFPVIFRNTGLNENGIPVFEDFYINDYPTEEDTAIDRVSDFWKKTLPEGKIIYGAPAPTVDFDQDGKLDIFLVSWWPEKPSMLLKNETNGGNWIQVKVQGKKEVNRMGVGAKIFIYREGKLGEKKFLMGTQDIGVGYGYASGHEAIAHFGLGEQTKVDIEVVLPHKKGKIVRKGVDVNRRIIMEE